jgi:BirA family biotin operon repressor/biotin-[acetyl-CoA-carboxylase] ligase
MNFTLFQNVPYVENFISYQCITSTNETAHELESFPKKGIFIIQADRQTNGKGRRGNNFFSDSTGGLWVTIVTRIDDLSQHFTFNRALSISIAETLIEQYPSDNTKIKWPNDIYISDKKICGILLEMHRKRNDILIIGFGININTSKNEFPCELQSNATSLSIETGTTYSLDDILFSIINKYIQWICADQYLSHRRYTELLYKSGTHVKIEDKSGIFKTVMMDGQLKLITEYGTELINSGTLRFI